ncbi:basic amino acid ABC transporter substrate-binding protein [Candidatus Acetothermia bacterium]|nr:basic amino acid ABC transporter substrate-binding protein [Candidatus Acetothermia bacterium]MCI2436813.1 basic amino acid ABC transporter substrate-binding protein [Candidatus Acetothermia bacterium]
MSPKIGKWFVAVGMLALVVGLVSGIPQAQTPTFKVCSDIAWPPFEWVDAKGQFVGFDLDVMRIIALLKGYRVEIQNLGFDSIIPAVQAGQCDIGASGFTITDERKKIVDFSDPYWESNQAVLVHTASGLNIITAFKAGNIIGAQRGTTGADWVEQNVIKQGINVTLRLYETYPLAEQDLINRRIHAVVEDEPAAKVAVKASKGALKIAGVINTEELFGFLVQKGDPKRLLARINDGMKEMRRKGIWNNLVEAYFGVDVNLDRVAQCYGDLKGWLDKNQPEAYAENLAACMSGQAYKKP